MCKIRSKREIVAYLKELSAIVHEEKQQVFTLGSSKFIILDNRSLKHVAHQGPVVGLK